MHRKRSFRINWPALMLAACFVVFAGYQAMAMRHLRNLQPAVVATVDLHRVMTQTEERKLHDAAVQELVDQLQRDGAELRKRLDEAEDETGLHAAGSDLQQKAIDKVSLLAHEYRGFNDWARQKIESESAFRLRQLYADLRNVIREEAEANGYDLVIVNDSLGEIRAGSEGEVTMQITSRRVLYAGGRLDITDAVIERMDRAAQRAQGG